MLREIVGLLTEGGFELCHVDATVVMERPRLTPARELIRATLAAALGLPTDHVSVKATSGEGIGFVGREEGAAALAVATVEGHAGGAQDARGRVTRDRGA